MTQHHEGMFPGKSRLPLTETEPIGLRRGTVRLAPYRPEWQRLYEEEASRLRTALGDHALQIEHVGSTAIDGMIAKPIIDIGIAVERLTECAAVAETLVSIGYEHIPADEIDGRLFLVKGPPDVRQIHLSLAEPASTFWRRHVLFRDYLRAQPLAAAEYATLKRQLAARYSEDRASYTAGKEAFIERVLAAAILGVDWREG